MFRLIVEFNMNLEFLLQSNKKYEISDYAKIFNEQKRDWIQIGVFYEKSMQPFTSCTYASRTKIVFYENKILIFWLDFYVKRKCSKHRKDELTFSSVTDTIVIVSHAISITKSSILKMTQYRLIHSKSMSRD